MIRTLTATALVKHVGFLTIWVVWAPLVNVVLVVTIRSSTTDLIAVVETGTIKSGRGDLVDTGGADIAPR